MSWLDSLFKRSLPLQEEETVYVGNLIDWFLEQSEPLIEEIKEEITDQLLSVKRNAQDVKEKLRFLQEAELQNKDIPEKARQIMDGNRESYIKLTTSFLESISIPEEVTYLAVSSFVSDYHDQLKTMQKMTQRNYHVLQEFFLHESNDIISALSTLDDSMKGLLDNNLKRILDLKKKVMLVNAIQAQKKKLVEDVEQEEYALRLNDKLIADTKSAVQHLRTTPLFFELERLHHQKEAVLSKMSQQKTRLLSFFMQLERPLRKYTYFVPADKDIVESYLTSPLQSLLGDPSYRIINVLNNVDQMIVDNHIELKDKEQERTLSKLRELNEGSLRSMIQVYHDAKQQLVQIEKNLKVNPIQQQLEEAEYKLRHLLEKEKRMAEWLEKKKEQLEKAIDEPLFREIQDEITSIFQKTVTITFEQHNEEH